MPEGLQIRLLGVAYPLLTGSADWCLFDEEPSDGFILQEDVRGTSTGNALARSEAVVAYVYPRLLAALAGPSVGDVTTHVNTVDVAGDSSGQIGELVR